MEPLVLPGTLDALAPIRQFVREAAGQARLAQQAAYDLQLAVDEIATNIVTHGYEDSGIGGDIRVEADLNPERLAITLEDSAPAFDPRGLITAAARLLDAPLSERPIGGLGIFLTEQKMDGFEYEYRQGHNRNRFIMRRPGGKGLAP